MENKTYIFSEPKQNSKGLWVSEVTDERGFTVFEASYTSKQSLLKWIENTKQELGTN